MSAHELLERANKAGLNVVHEGDQLRVRGPRESANLAQLLIQNKVEIIAILTAAAPTGVVSDRGDGDETSPFSEETGVSSPPVKQELPSEPPTSDDIRFWLECLREKGCRIALVYNIPAIEWSEGMATPGRLRDWQANIDIITAVLEAQEERLAIQEE